VACTEGKKVKSAELGGTTIPDVDREDNEYRWK